MVMGGHGELVIERWLFGDLKGFATSDGADQAASSYPHHRFVSQLLEGLLHSCVCGFQSLWQNPSLCDDGHEISVAGPAGQDMHVDVAGNTGSRSFAQIHA